MEKCQCRLIYRHSVEDADFRDKSDKKKPHKEDLQKDGITHINMVHMSKVKGDSPPLNHTIKKEPTPIIEQLASIFFIPFVVVVLASALFGYLVIYAKDYANMMGYFGCVLAILLMVFAWHVSSIIERRACGMKRPSMLLMIFSRSRILTLLASFIFGCLGFVVDEDIDKEWMAGLFFIFLIFGILDVFGQHKH